VAQVGSVLIEVGVHGKNDAGQPFEDRAIFQVFVAPVVARLVSVEANPVDSDGDGKFDRLDLIADLDVVTPGNYLVAFSVADQQQRTVQATTSADLRAGRQSMTAHIDGWRIWNDLRGGPYAVRVAQLFRHPDTSTLDELVGGLERISGSVNRSRDDWDHGPTYGEDRVRIHGIDPAPSGRFRLAEAEWEVNSPGGRCEWGGDLYYQGGDRLHSGRSSELAAGRRKVSFFFNGGDLAAEGAHDWKMEVQFSCEGVPSHAALVGLPVQVNGSEYEALPGNPLLDGTDRLSGFRRGFWSFNLHANAEGGVQLSLSGVPKELDAHIVEVFDRPPNVWATLAVTALPGTSPGRYFLTVNAASGNGATAREIALDISPLDVLPDRR
jgi:hypothetical protein